MALKVQQIACNGCGAKVDIRTGLRMKTFVCDHCGSVCDGKQVLAVQEKEAARQRYRPSSPLKLGLVCKLLGQTYQIVGRIRVEEQSWFWDEWFLMSATGFPVFLQEDQGRFSLFRIFYPTIPLDPRSAGSFIQLDKQAGNIVVKERGEGRIAYIEGELTWRAVPGETFGYLDAYRGKDRFSIEWSEHEFQYFKGQSRSPSTIYALFSLDTEAQPGAAAGAAAAAAASRSTPAGKKQKAKKEKKSRLAMNLLLGSLFLCGLFLLLLSAFSDGCTNSDGFSKKFAAYTFHARTATAKEPMKDKSGKAVRDKHGRLVMDYHGVLLTDAMGKPIPIKLPKSSGAYELRIGSSGLGYPGWSGQSCYWVEVTLLKEHKDAKPDDDEDERYREIRSFSTSFWRETGIDEGERWDEKDLSSSHFFRASDRGPYYIRVAADNCDTSRTNAVHGAKVTIALYKDVWMSRWLIYAGLALLGFVILGKMTWWSD